MRDIALLHVVDGYPAIFGRCYSCRIEVQTRGMGADALRDDNRPRMQVESMRIHLPDLYPQLPQSRLHKAQSRRINPRHQLLTRRKELDLDPKSGKDGCQF